MKLKVFTLRFSHEINGFDDKPVQAFLDDKQVVEVKDHFFVHEKVPYLNLLVSYRDVGSLERESRKRKEDPRAALDPQERQIYDALRAWRWAMAQQEGIAPYVIMNNRQTAECVKIRARTNADLAQIRGIGEAKVDKYGAQILEIIASHSHPLTAKTETQNEENSHDA